MTEKYEVLAKELENTLNAFSKDVNHLLKEMFTLKEDTDTEKVWEMKCPYKEGDEYWPLDSHGNILLLNCNLCVVSYAINLK